MEITNLHPRGSLPWRFALGVLSILALSLGAFYLVLNPPMAELGWMAAYLAVTAVVSGVAAYGAYRLGWVQRSPTLLMTILGAYALASGLTFLNVWLAAWQMFASDHDLVLATVLLFFAGGIAMVLGYFFAIALTDRIQTLDRAARRVAAGDLEVRVPVEGHDELARLATTFNQMATDLEAAAQKQQELEGLRRDLVAWAGHDLQTPLASMRAVVEALADGMVDDPETQQRYLRIAQREIESLSLLIDDLSQMSQLDAGGLILEREDNSLSDLISDTLESFSSLAARQEVSLQGRAGPEVDPVWMDARRIGRVLNNLVSNALRHTPPGGRVTLQAVPIHEGVLIEVTDTGAGIRPEDLPHVFERFYRGDKSRSRTTGGSGLGLAIARGIIEAHGGYIDVESLPHHTRFYFVLPGKS